jgi:hypothetical protein
MVADSGGEEFKSLSVEGFKSIRKKNQELTQRTRRTQRAQRRENQE